MQLEKKDMPGVKVFTDVNLNFNKMDYIATLPEAWKDKGCFVVANAAAFLYRRFGHVWVFLSSRTMSINRSRLKGGMRQRTVQLPPVKRN
jgi:hypothetical protein